MSPTGRNIKYTNVPGATSGVTNRNFIANILRAKRTIIQDRRADDGVNDPAERNEEPPD